VPVCVSLSPILLLFDCDYFCFVGWSMAKGSTKWVVGSVNHWVS
jgi:hypothetical protein